MKAVYSSRSRLQRRRIVNVFLLVIACVLVTTALSVVEISFLNPSEWSGWLLVASVVVLLTYMVRKRLSTLPLGRVSIWLQAHIYLGLFCLYSFFLHIGWRLPTGWFDIALAAAFCGTVITGLLGWYFCRVIPGLLARLGEDVLYERIPGFVHQTREDAESLVLKAVRETGSDALAEFYRGCGSSYFASARFHWGSVFRSDAFFRKVRRSLNTSRRFMSAAEAEYAGEMARLVRQKRDLDAHYSLQGILKYWLFVHFAFSIAVIPILLVHIVLAYAMGGV